ncbi:hypothetical protein Tco_0456759 [Tanacetum coccineum]
MLAPSSGGLILYQAYGNLYAMTGRKAYLLEDKKIPSVGVFDDDAEIQITSSENAHHQEERTKGLLLEEYGAIAAKMRKKRLKTKLVL